MTFPRTRRFQRWSYASLQIRHSQSPGMSVLISWTVHCSDRNGVNWWNSLTRIGGPLRPNPRPLALLLKDKVKLAVPAVLLEMQLWKRKSNRSSSLRHSTGLLRSQDHQLLWQNWRISWEVNCTKWSVFLDQHHSSWPQALSYMLEQRKLHASNLLMRPLCHMELAHGSQEKKQQSFRPTTQTVGFHASWRMMNFQLSSRTKLPKMLYKWFMLKKQFTIYIYIYIVI